MNFSGQAVGLDCPWLLLVLLPFHQESGTGRGSGAGSLLGRTGQQSCDFGYCSWKLKPELCLQPHSKDSAAECWSVNQVCHSSKPMFCLNTHVVTGKTELSGPKMNCVRGRTRSWRELEEEMWSAGGVRQDHPWSHPQGPSTRNLHR